MKDYFHCSTMTAEKSLFPNSLPHYWQNIVHSILNPFPRIPQPILDWQMPTKSKNSDTIFRFVKYFSGFQEYFGIVSCHLPYYIHQKQH